MHPLTDDAVKPALAAQSPAKQCPMRIRAVSLPTIYLHEEAMALAITTCNFSRFGCFKCHHSGNFRPSLRWHLRHVWGSLYA